MRSYFSFNLSCQEGVGIICDPFDPHNMPICKIGWEICIFSIFVCQFKENCQ